MLCCTSNNVIEWYIFEGKKKRSRAKNSTYVRTRRFSYCCHTIRSTRVPGTWLKALFLLCCFAAVVIIDTAAVRSTVCMQSADRYTWYSHNPGYIHDFKVPVPDRWCVYASRGHRAMSKYIVITVTPLFTDRWAPPAPPPRVYTKQYCKYDGSCSTR